MTTVTPQQQADEETLARLGFEKRYRLCGHPAYPDPLDIWPPTEENADRIYAQYCTDSFEEYVESLGYVPLRFGGGKMTAQDFNPRILITWEFKGEREIYRPASVDAQGANRG